MKCKSNLFILLLKFLQFFIISVRIKVKTLIMTYYALHDVSSCYLFFPSPLPLSIYKSHRGLLDIFERHYFCFHFSTGYILFLEDNSYTYSHDLTLSFFLSIRISLNVKHSIITFLIFLLSTYQHLTNDIFYLFMSYCFLVPPLECTL